MAGQVGASGTGVSTSTTAGFPGISMPSGIGSWRRPENSARFVVRRPREERRATFTAGEETHNFRVPDHTFGITENKIKSCINERSGLSGIYR